MIFLNKFFWNVVLASLFLSGCSANLIKSEAVSPWEKGYLADPNMAWEPDRLESEFMRHAYFSKEATATADRSSGGGCGCN